MCMEGGRVVCVCVYKVCGRGGVLGGTTQNKAELVFQFLMVRYRDTYI